MIAPAISLSQLESHLWEAANILRGPVDAADFKTYVFPLLFSNGFRTSTTKNTKRPSLKPTATRSTPDSRRIIVSRGPNNAIGRMSARWQPMSTV
jgi:hypothetical protein